VETPAHTPPSPSPSIPTGTRPHPSPRIPAAPELRPRALALELHAELDDFHRVRRSHLEEPRASARRHLLPEANLPVAVRGREALAEDVVDRELDRLLRRHADEVRLEPALEPRRALRRDDLAEAVDRPRLARGGARALVLEARLHHVKRAVGGGAARSRRGGRE
jgi:hypothetical protein